MGCEDGDGSQRNEEFAACPSNTNSVAVGGPSTKFLHAINAHPFPVLTHNILQACLRQSTGARVLSDHAIPL